MGNKQCTTSVFQDEEEEETWFEWMETTANRKNQKQLAISPKTQPLPVQPANFQADVTNRARNIKHRIPGEDKTLKRLHLARSENARLSVDSSIRGDLKENNNLPIIKEDLLDLDLVAGQVSEGREVKDYIVQKIFYSLCFEDRHRFIFEYA